MFDVSFTEFYNPANLLWGELDFPEIDLSAFGLEYPFVVDLEPVTDADIVTEAGLVGDADVAPDTGVTPAADATAVIVVDAAGDPAPDPSADPLAPADVTQDLDPVSLDGPETGAEPLPYEIDYAALDLTILQIGQSFNAFSHLI